MNSRINNICQVEYAPLKELYAISDNYTEPVVIDAGWQTLDCAHGASMTIADQTGNSGQRFTTTFNCSLNSSQQVKGYVIVKITTDDGTVLIIGDTDLPVTFSETNALKSKSLQFTHLSWHYPYTTE